MAEEVMNTAWVEIEYNEIWDRFDAEFRFRPGTGPIFLRTAIKEPSPSETYSIAHIFGQGEDHYTDLNNDLMAFALAMFQSLTAVEEWIYALDWQHQAFKFFPHIAFELDEFGEWPVPVLPNGDYYIFFKESLVWGVFGHPWEKTMCFWGDDVLTCLHENRPRLLTKLVRKK
jgi:hypothetical protein